MLQVAHIADTFFLVHHLSRRLLEGIKQAQIHRDEFAAFDEHLRERFGSTIVDWEGLISAWNKDHSLPCPYIPSI